MIWHKHVSSVATAAGKKLGYLSRARKYFSPSNLLTLHKAQIRPIVDYCSHIWGVTAPTTLSKLDAVQRSAIRLIGDVALTCHLQPQSHRRRSAVGDLSQRCKVRIGLQSTKVSFRVSPSPLLPTTPISPLCKKVKYPGSHRTSKNKVWNDSENIFKNMTHSISHLNFSSKSVNRLLRLRC
nr:unnamed protein product [Callosobruchus chinensis]